MTKIPSSWYSIDCNPFTDSSCTTTPEQIMLDVDTAVCAYVYDDKEDCQKYTMNTYVNREAAMDDGAFITHEGSCGLCSTAQDLALYMSKSFVEIVLLLYLCIIKFICNHMHIYTL